jgi:signal transduction histidine kinase
VRLLRSVGRSRPPREGGTTRMLGVLLDVTGRQDVPAERPLEPAGAVSILGLPEALRARAAQFELRTGISVEVMSAPAADGLDPVTALALYRIADHCLDNVQRHAHARRAVVELDYEGGVASLTVRDDGGGFAPDWQAKGGAGIKRMRESAAAVGGKVWIESAPGNGSVLRITARG